MRTISTTVIFIVLLVGLCVYVAQVAPTRIEDSIRVDIEQQFVLNDLANITISVNGRDVSLSGEVDSQDKINQAMKLASSRAGVRVVMTSVSVHESTTSKQLQQPSSN